MNNNKWLYVTIMVIAVSVLIAMLWQQHEANQCYLTAIQSGMDDTSDIIKLCDH